MVRRRPAAPPGGRGWHGRPRPRGGAGSGASAPAPRRAASGRRAAIAGKARIACSMPLFGREQAEGQQHRPALGAQLSLVKLRVHERHVGDAVRHDREAVLRHAVGRRHDLARALRHHHEAGGAAHDRFHHPPLPGRRPLEHRVQRRDHGHARPLEQRQQELAVWATEDAVLVLHAEHVGVGIVQEVGCAQVGARVRLRDLQPDLGRVGVRPGPVRHGKREALGLGRRAGDRGAQVRGEGGEAAHARWVVAQEGHAVQRRGGRQGHVASSHPGGNRLGSVGDCKPGHTGRVAALSRHADGP